MRFFLKLKQVKKAIEEKFLWMKIENFNWSFFQQRGWGADKKVHLAVLTNLMILLNCTVLHGPELQWYYLSDHEWLIYIIFRKLKFGRMILNQWFILVAVKSSCRIQQIWWCDEVLNTMVMIFIFCQRKDGKVCNENPWHEGRGVLWGGWMIRGKRG